MEGAHRLPQRRRPVRVAVVGQELAAVAVERLAVGGHVPGPPRPRRRRLELLQIDGRLARRREGEDVALPGQVRGRRPPGARGARDESGASARRAT